MKYIRNIALAILLCGMVGGAIAQPKATIQQHEGVPTLFIDGKIYPPYAYMSYLGERKFYKEVAESGLHLYNIPAYLGDQGINSTSGIRPFRPSVWVGENKFDYSSVEHDFDEILAEDTAAMVVIRVHLDAPLWWQKAHPEGACQLPDGSVFRTSYYSDLWRVEAGKVLANMIQYLSKSKYNRNLIGIHVAGGRTEEWLYHYKTEFYDENPVRLEGFKKWLRSKYNNNATALQAAWAQPDVSFETVTLADISGKQRQQQWRDSSKAGHFFDTFSFHSETMADNIDHFCRIVKESSNGTLLTGAFFGYHYFVSDSRMGHGALSKLLRSKHLDYLSSPNDYHRVSGEDWAPFAAIKSVQLHGKLWLAENDTRTSITTLLKDRAPNSVPPTGTAYTDGVWLGPATMQESVSLLQKNLGRMLTYGYGGWWFDMWGGWFSDPQLMNIIKSGQEYFHQYPDKHIPAMDPQVAVIVDEKLGFMDASFGGLTGKILHNRFALGRMGAPYDLYLREDIDAVHKNQYKVIWVMGFLTLTEKEKNWIARQTKSGKYVLWTDGHTTKQYAPDGKTPTETPLQWDAQALNDLLKKAGVHRYLQTGGDVLYAGRGWISIHSVEGGKKVLHLPSKARIIDPSTGKSIAHTNKLTIDMPRLSTKLFRIK